MLKFACGIFPSKIFQGWREDCIQQDSNPRCRKIFEGRYERLVIASPPCMRMGLETPAKVCRPSPGQADVVPVSLVQPYEFEKSTSHPQRTLQTGQRTS